MSNQQLSANQIAYLNRAMSDGNGLIEIGELARGLGKRPDNVKRKLERIFPEDHLLNLRKRYKAPIGKGHRGRLKLTCSTTRPLALSLCHMTVC